MKSNANLFAAIKSTYRDFAEHTSIHGLKYTVKAEVKIYEKVFWTILVVSGLSGAGYMTVLFWNRFISNPTRTSILTSFAPTTAIPFPAVTICNINRILVDKVDEFISKLEIPDGQEPIIHQAIPQLLAFAEPTAIAFNTTELGILHDVLIKNDWTDVNQVMKKLTQPCSELLVKCRWNFSVTSCMKLFQESYTIEGLCCSFNYSNRNKKKAALRSSYSGMNSGLTVLLDPMVQRVQYSRLHSSGLRVLLHSAYDYPGMDAVAKIVSRGRLSYLELTGAKIECNNNIRALSLEQRQCSYPDERKLRFFPEYSDSNCLIECDALYFFSKCSCVPFYFSFTNRPVCNVTSIPCLHEAEMLIVNKEEKHCDCPTQCEEQYYDVLSSTTNFIHNITSYTSSFLYNTTLRENDIMIHVFFASDQQTILLRNTITSTIYLLSSFGGVYSLFLGCSFVTLIEIIYFVSLRFVVNLKILGKIQSPDSSGSDKLKNVRFKKDIRKIERSKPVWSNEANRIFVN